MPGPGSVAWPNPELSIGRESLRLRRKKVWEAKGPALERFENEIFKVINELLDAHKEQLETGEQISRTYSFHLWMVGREVESAVPTIIFTSKSAKLREKVTKLIKKHEILDNFPGFALNSMDRMPAVPMGPPPPRTDASRLEDKISVSKGDAVYALMEPIDMCGTLVSINGDDETTLGGTIIIGDDFYGFIALHPRDDESEDSESIICRNSDLRFDDESDVTSTATASLRPSASLRSARNSTLEFSNFNSPNPYIEENKYNPLQKQWDGGSKISLAQSTYINTTINHAERLVTPRQIGTVVAESTRNGLNYGIFLIEDPQYRIPNRIRLPFNDPRDKRYLYPQGVASEVQEGDAWISAGKSGPIKGTIIKNPYFIKLAGSDKYQKMWPVQLEQDIVPGDCGSWVVDSNSGRLYGHVVAGDSTLHRAYFIEAVDVFEDIRNKMNVRVRLPVLRFSSDLSILSKSYADAVSSISEESSSYSLYPGADYFSLAEYLSRPERFVALSPPTVSEQAMPIHVVVHEIDNLQRTISHFRDPADFHWYTTQRSATNSNLLIFLKGTSSPDWIRTLGSDYSVDPEFFQVHLDFLFRRTNFSLPGPPSSSRTLRLRLTTLGMAESMKSQSANSWHNRCVKSMQAYRKDLQSLKGFPLATSIIRKLSCFDDGTFALEQELSISIIELQGRWIVLIWSDVGLPLHQGPGPWTDQFPLSPTNSFLLPIVQARPKNGLNIQDTSGVRPTSPSDTWAQSAAILPSQYGKTLKTEIMREDPLYAMSDLLRFVSFSEIQFLNMINNEIDRVSNIFGGDGHHISKNPREGRTDPISSLYYIRKILASHIQRLEENISMIKAEIRVSQKRHRNLDDVSQAIVEATSESLLEDFGHLLRRANSLSTMCESCITIFTSRLAMMQADQAEYDSMTMKSITILTMFFLPGTFVATIFSMNLYDSGAGPTFSIVAFRRFFYVAVPLTFVVFLTWWIMVEYNKMSEIIREKTRLWKEKVL